MPFPPSDLKVSRSRLRRELRARRAAMTAGAATAAARACAEHLSSSELFRNSGHVAGYASIDRELDPTPLLGLALAAGKSVYLPRVITPTEMEFVAWKTGDPLASNRFGIPEPVSRNAVVRAPESLDLVLVPLLGFDTHGNRLGFGGGFYDRAFAFRHSRGVPPLLCGYAYDDQRCAELQTAEWDVALDAIVTQSGLRFFSRQR